MAETVGLHIESMIPELEQMKRLGLFTGQEVQEIVKKRKELEYKISRNMKEKQDFLKYINFEVKLLREIKLRRDRLHMSEKKSDIEYTVAKRIVKIYQLALSYFKSEVRLWVSYINFCTQTKFTNVVSQAFKQMLQVHSDKVNLWVFAAKWELSESSNIEGALNYLKTGLHHHPQSQELYAESFRLELKAGTINPLDATQEERKNKQNIALRRASIHFKVAINAIGHEVEFIINMLEIATDFKYTFDLQLEIIEVFTRNCWKSELMWYTMAQRELNGHHFNKEDANKNKTLLCIAVFKNAIKILPTVEMWGKFLDTLMEISSDQVRKHTLDQNMLLTTFEQGHNGLFLLEHHYLFWLELLNKDPKYPEALEKATKALPKSVDLWEKRLKYYAVQNDSELYKNTGIEAIKALKGNALPIYLTLIKYYQMKASIHVFSEEVKQIYEEGISRPEPEISHPLRCQYIEWLSIGKGIKMTRSAYEKMASQPPFCLELHKKMLHIEKGRFEPSIGFMRSIHTVATQQFGREKTEVWMDFIQFELEFGEPANVSDIYNRAKNILNPDLIPVFTTDYAVLNAN